MKPILKLAEAIRIREKLLTGYQVLFHDLNLLRIEVRQRGAYGDSLHKEFIKALKRKGDLIQQQPTSRISKKLRQRCFDEVNAELPMDSFYIPPGE